MSDWAPGLLGAEPMQRRAKLIRKDHEVQNECERDQHEQPLSHGPPPFWSEFSNRSTLSNIAPREDQHYGHRGDENRYLSGCTLQKARTPIFFILLCHEQPHLIVAPHADSR
jgi:hypothetical protein